MDPMNVLQPNYMGNTLNNTGLDELFINRGLGVDEVTNKAKVQSRKTLAAPEIEKNRLRTAKAREFGLTKQTVGF